MLKRLAEEVGRNNRIVVSAVTYTEMRYGQIGKKALPRHKLLVDEFVKRLDEVLPWDQRAVDHTIAVKAKLTDSGMTIGGNDTAIAGHAMAMGCTLVTNNTREFSRVDGLIYEDWAH